jgi:hypothetical protein
MGLREEERQLLMQASSKTHNGEEFARLTKARQEQVAAHIDGTVAYLKIVNPRAFLLSEEDLKDRVFFDVPITIIEYKHSVKLAPRSKP